MKTANPVLRTVPQVCLQFLGAPIFRGGTGNPLADELGDFWTVIIGMAFQAFAVEFCRLHGHHNAMAPQYVTEFRRRHDLFHLGPALAEDIGHMGH